MVKSVKTYFQEQGMASELALQLDEVTSAMHSRMHRFNKQGVSKNLVMIDLGKYRHMETRNPKNNQEMLRLTLDGMLLVLNLEERFRLLEHYDVIKPNHLTAEYEFTAFGKQFFELPKP